MRASKSSVTLVLLVCASLSLEVGAPARPGVLEVVASAVDEHGLPYTARAALEE